MMRLASYDIIKSPTFTDPGEYNLISNPFENEAFVQQKKAGVIPALNSLRVLQMPAGLKSIEEEAFEGISCQAVIIPDSCVSIGSRAFAGCKDLIYVFIPAGVTSISSDAFEDCHNVIIDRAGE